MICQKSRKTNISKKNVCRKQPQLREEVDAGKQLAVEVCQQNFLDRKWNCSTTHSSFRRIMKTGLLFSRDNFKLPKFHR